MPKFIFSFLCLLWCTLTTLCGQNNLVYIRGKVVDQESHQLEMVNILIKGTTLSAVTNKEGEFLLPPVYERSVVLNFTSIGYEKTERLVMFPETHSPILQVLKTEVKSIHEITIEKKRDNFNIQGIQPKLTDRLPTMAGGVETLIKTLPGVSSNNELSIR